MSLEGNVEFGGVLRGKINRLDELRGYSAYELALIHGFEGTEEEWLDSLKPDGGYHEKKLNTHIADKSNPHGVTAAQVGARPVSWTPTAADVGAAPAGHGLGETPRTSEDVNLELTNGYFRTTTATANSPFTHGAGHVRSYNASEAVQNIFRLSNAGVELLRYTLDGGATWTEDWVAPQMLIGTEYRTRERFNNKPVYAKVVSFGALPASSRKTVNHGVSDMENCISIAGTTNENGMNIVGFEGLTYLYRSGNDILVATTADLSDLTANIILKYTKTTY